MPTIWKDNRKGHNRYWMCSFSLGNGKRKSCSTKQTSEKEARRIADEWEKAAEQAARGELSEAQSRKVLDSIRKAYGGGALAQKSVEQLFRDWLDEQKGAVKASTFKIYSQPVHKFLSFL
jgi:hypothetical protein